MTIHLHRARWRRIREVSRRVTLTKECDFFVRRKKESPAQFSSFVVKSQPGVSQDCLGRQSFGWDQHQQPGVRIADDKTWLDESESG